MRLRLALGVGILVLFLCAGLLASFAMDEVCAPVVELLEQAANHVQQGNAQAAVQLAEKAHKQWNQHSSAIATLADHSPMEEIDSLFAQTLTYGRQGAITDFSAGCQRLATLVKAVSEAHSLVWQNIL